MIEIIVNIRKGGATKGISLSLDEYVEFIEEQSKLLNLMKETNPLVRNLERTHPGIESPMNHITVRSYKGEGSKENESIESSFD